MSFVSFFYTTEKNTLHSTLRWYLIRNCLIWVECASFGTIQPSTPCQHSRITSLCHTTLTSFHDRFSKFGHSLYTLYDGPLYPGSCRAQALCTATRFTFICISFILNPVIGSIGDLRALYLLNWDLSFCHSGRLQDIDRSYNFTFEYI